MKVLLTAFVGFCALNSMANSTAKKPNIHQSLGLVVFEEIVKYDHGIGLIMSSMDSDELNLRRYRNIENYPELIDLRQRVQERCEEAKREIEDKVYANYLGENLSVHATVKKVARMHESVGNNMPGITDVEAQVGSACKISLWAAEGYAIAETKTIMGNKAEDCVRRLDEVSNENTLIQKIKTGWGVFTLNYCRIDQYDLIKR